MTQAAGFFVELYNRLRTTSPKFFFVLQLFTSSLTLAGYIPSMLQVWFNVEVPGHVIALCEDVSKYASGFLAASLLPVASPRVAKTDGTILKKTDQAKLPFTDKSEKKAEAKEEIKLPEATIEDK